MDHDAKAAFRAVVELFSAIEPIRNYGDRMDMSPSELEHHVREVDRLCEVSLEFFDHGCGTMDLWTLLDAATWEAFRVSRECKEHLNAGWHNIDNLWKDYRSDQRFWDELRQDHPDQAPPQDRR